MPDLEYPPQTQIRGRVRLTDPRGDTLEDKDMSVWQGEPIGDWVEFRGHRIALKRVRSNVFDGIVPDDFDNHPERLQSFGHK